MNAILERAAHLSFTLKNLVDALSESPDTFGHDARVTNAMFYARSALLPENAVDGEAAAIAAITSGQ